MMTFMTTNKAKKGFFTKIIIIKFIIEVLANAMHSGRSVY